MNSSTIKCLAEDLYILITSRAATRNGVRTLREITANYVSQFSSQLPLQGCPAKGRTRVRLSSWRNNTVACDIHDSIAHHKTGTDLGKDLILRFLVGNGVASFQLDADAIVITVLTTIKAGGTCMPGPSVKRHELDQLARLTNKKVTAWKKLWKE